MTLRSRSRTAFVAAASLALAAPATAQPATVTETVLSEDVVVLRGRVANMVAVRTSAGLVIVDALISPLHARLARERLAARFPGLPVRYLISTHYHLDHNFGAQEYPDAILIAHRANAARAPGTQATADLFLRAPAELSRLRGQLTAGTPAPAGLAAEIELWETRLARYAGFGRRAADLIIDGDLTVRLGGKTIEIRHPPPGHTDGDLVVHFVEDGVLATGDLVFNRIVPVIDLDGGVDLRGWTTTLDALSATPGVRHVVPGHGDAGSVTILDEQARYLRDLVTGVEAARREGLTLAAAKARVALAAYAGYEPMFGERAGNVEACWQWLDRQAAGGRSLR